jgi:penicillin-binding protein 1A
VIAVMVEQGGITPEEATAADPRLVRFAPQARLAGVRYFTGWVLTELENLTDEANEPLLVETTLNSQMQRDAEAAIRAEAPKGAQGCAGGAGARWRRESDGGRHRLCALQL